MLGIGPMCYTPEAPPSQKARSQTPGTPRLEEFSKAHLPKVNCLDSANFRMGDGSTKRPGLMGKIFGRQGSLDRSTDCGDNSDESRTFDPINSLNLQPCPFIRPVPGMRMVARDEPNQILSVSRNSPTPQGNTSIGKCRERAEAIINESSISEEESHSYNEQSAYDDSSQVDGESEDYSLSIDVGKQHEFVVLSSAPVGNAVAVADWTIYIKFYSQGYFNLTSPPPPPPRGTTFEYLPAIYPPNEEARLAKHSAFDVLWPEWTQDKACALITSSMARFQTKYASLSLFDGRYEVFKAENGYHTSRIERARSIAAHVLLSTDTLVILDTEKDWRFQRNPCVIGPPYIRFFAGAPMLASSGEVIGVFAVFSREPRNEFSPSERREVAEFATLAMNDLTFQAESLAGSDFQTTSTMPRRETQINLFPEALRFHKVPSPVLDGADSFIQEQSDYSVRSSRDRDSGVLYMAAKKPHTHCRSLSADSSVSVIGNDNFHDLMTPRAFRVPPPRPFSSSDLTSVDMEHPNTPNQSNLFIEGKENYRLTMNRLSQGISAISTNDDIEEFHADDSIIASSFLREHPHVTTSSYGTTITRRSSFQSMSTISTVLSSRIGAPNDDDHAEYDEDNSSHLSTAKKVPIRGSKGGDNIPLLGGVQTDFAQPFVAEARFSCAFSASSLGYDLIYAVEVVSVRPFMAHNELSRPGALKLTILAAYGLESTSVFSSDIHLQALQSRDGITSWTNLDTENLRREGSYEFGVLIALSHGDSHGEGCSSGVVFGAFKKPIFDSNGDLYPSVQNTTGLKAAAKAMREIIFNYGGGPRRPSTDPTTPTTPAWQAPETAATSPNYNRRSFPH
ncbi:hypothetical protein ACMFMG_006782 [Clarireedia jacksonii]